jgi:hypothetical protein
LAAFTNKWAGDYSFGRGNGNNRVTQPLNGRTIYYSSAINIIANLMFALVMIGTVVLA